MKQRIFIKSLALFFLAPAFSIGAAQASSYVDQSGPQGSLSQMGAFQMAVVVDSLPDSDDIGSDGLKRRGDGSIDDDQPGQENDDDHKMRGRNRGHGSGDDDHERRGRNRGHGNADDVTGDTARTDNSGKGRMERLDDDNQGRGRGRGRNRGRGNIDDVVIDDTARTDNSGKGRMERLDEDNRGRGRGRGRHGRVDRVERQDRSGKSDRAERPDRSGRRVRAERPDRSGRSEKVERPDRSGRGGRG